MRCIEDDMRLRPAGDLLVGDLTEHWNVIGVNGGYLAALLLSAAETRHPAMTPVSLTVQFAARAQPGEISIRVHPVRETSSSALLQLTGEQQGTTTVLAQLWLAAPGARRLALPSDRVIVEPAPDTLLEVDERRRRAGLPIPTFPLFGQLEERPVDWWDPAERSGSDPMPRQFRTWLQMAPAEAAGPWSVARRACVLLDAFPVMALVRSVPYEVSGTVITSLTLNVEFDDPADPQLGWCLGEFAAVGSSRGSVEASGTLWTQKGSRVASGVQRVLTQALRKPGSRTAPADS